MLFFAASGPQRKEPVQRWTCRQRMRHSKIVEKCTQPPGHAAQFVTQTSRSLSQLRLTSGLLSLSDVQLFPQTFKHRSKSCWQLAIQLLRLWAILFFGTGVKLPAKLIVIEERRMIAAALSFIRTPKKAITIKVCASII